MASKKLTASMERGLIAWLRGDGESLNWQTSDALGRRGYLSLTYDGQKYRRTINDHAVAWGQARNVEVVDPRPAMHERAQMVAWCEKVEVIFYNGPNCRSDPKAAVRHMVAEMRELLARAPEVGDE